ncbi:hypothetical protein EXU85_28750 [Spirosoma sp. KCTC 42546]|uniref:hypothetical protein n=1 Tax=Spirosoma sp. KCTC 42546 TaxID=2520506 RepID=UPI001159BEA4|nr:hypothetical protein [Spirosoma sp. KCTC 42546]QDK82383.1 hypothetical protein EXU85_28750 [Spirosoma sp. KCTC 42546]
MKKGINDKIKTLQQANLSQEEFMKKLAEVDENGQLTNDLLEQVNGGIVLGKPISILIELPTLGMWLPTTNSIKI